MADSKRLNSLHDFAIWNNSLHFWTSDVILRRNIDNMLENAKALAPAFQTAHIFPSPGM